VKKGKMVKNRGKKGKKSGKKTSSIIRHEKMDMGA
jgi:hypothetical protein